MTAADGTRWRARQVSQESKTNLAYRANSITFNLINDSLLYRCGTANKTSAFEFVLVFFYCQSSSSSAGVGILPTLKHDDSCIFWVQMDVYNGVLVWKHITWEKFCWMWTVIVIMYLYNFHEWMIIDNALHGTKKKYKVQQIGHSCALINPFITDKLASYALNTSLTDNLNVSLLVWHKVNSLVFDVYTIPPSVECITRHSVLNKWS